MKSNYENLDSSSDEELKQNHLPPHHIDNLLKNILNINNVNGSKGLKLRLGLILHNLANKFFSYSIKDTYKEIKHKTLKLDDNDAKEKLNVIKTAFNKHLSELFTNDNKENPLKDKDYLKLYHFAFKPNISISDSFTLKNNITINDVKKVLFEELQNSNIDLTTLSKSPLNFTVHNSKEFLAFPALINRNNKNKLRHHILEEIDDNSATIVTLPNTRTKTFTANHVMHYKTGNAQTDVTGFGSYNEIFSEFNKEPKHIPNIIKRIFEIVKGKETTQTVQGLSHKLNHFAEKLTHLLFIVETHRNNTTLFTAPMFLELVDKDNKLLSEENLFPMSAQNAVAQVRDISKKYKNTVPNSSTIDYDTTNVKDCNKLLITEGDILIKWLSKKLNNFKLEKLITFFDTKNLITLYQFQDINNISIHYIKTFLEKAHELNFHHTETFKSLNSKLTDLLPKINNLGERSLKLIKTQLFKKLSPDLKELVEKVYAKFTESLEEFKQFLDQKQLTLKEKIEELLPEVLQILCTKIKEWYNIDIEESNNINLKFNETSLKFSLKRKNPDDKNDNNKILKTIADSSPSYDKSEEQHTSFKSVNNEWLENTSIEDALKLIGVGEVNPTL